VLWPAGFDGAFEWPAALIAIAAGIALLVFRRGVIEVLACCALAGLAVRLLG
jgi:chromate transporter